MTRPKPMEPLADAELLLLQAGDKIMIQTKTGNLYKEVFEVVRVNTGGAITTAGSRGSWLPSITVFLVERPKRLPTKMGAVIKSRGQFFLRHEKANVFTEYHWLFWGDGECDAVSDSYFDGLGWELIFEGVDE